MVALTHLVLHYMYIACLVHCHFNDDDPVIRLTVPILNNT